MHNQPADADLVSRCNMDKTLKEYIERTQKRMAEDNSQPMTPNPNQYNVIPENKNEEDRPQNPHGQH